MYPIPYHELSGWNIHSMTCGSSTFACAASAGNERSTITWGHSNGYRCGAEPSPAPNSSPFSQGTSCDTTWLSSVNRRHSLRPPDFLPMHTLLDIAFPALAVLQRTGLRPCRQEELSQPRQVHGAGGGTDAAGEARGEGHLTYEG